MHGTSSRVFTFKLIEEVDLWLLHMQMDAKLKHDTEVHITEVSKHGSKHLAALAGLQTLTIVGGNTIGAEGCKHLAALAGLQTLTIESNNEIGAEGCKYLAALTWLQSLCPLDLIRFSICCSLLAASTAALLHSTLEKVYWSINLSSNNADDPDQEFPMNTGPLFHWIVHDTFITTTTQVAFFKEVSLAWAVLSLLEAGLLALALRWTAPLGPIRVCIGGLTASFFVPIPLA